MAAFPAIFLAVVVALVGTLLGGCTGTLDGSAERNHAAQPAPPSIRVATSGDYAPFSIWPAADDEPRGYSADVARAYAAARGLRIEWLRFRWPELAADLAAGRFELAISGITIRPDRSIAGRFSLPLAQTGAVALVADPAGPLDPGELSGRAGPTGGPLEREALDDPSIAIGVNRGGHLEQVARTLFPRARIETLADNARVIDLLAAGRVDAVLTDSLEAPHWQRRLPGTRAIGPLTRDRKAAFLPVEVALRARDFDRWLLAAERSGELPRLRTRHGLPASPTASAREALLASLDERLSLMGAVAEAKRTLALPIEDPAQEARVRSAARRAYAEQARALGAQPPPPEAIDRFVAALMHAARFVQTRAAARPPTPTPTHGSRDPMPHAADTARRRLDAEIRPAVAYVSERIAWLVAETARDAASGAPADRAPFGPSLAHALAGHALPDATIRELALALEALVMPPPTGTGGAPTHRAPPARPDTTSNG